MHRSLSVLPAIAGVLALTVVFPASANSIPKTGAQNFRTSNSSQVVVPRGQPVEVAFADDLTGSASGFAMSLANAVQMAVDAHPGIRGFPIQINLVNAPCDDPTADVAAATSIVANTQNVGVIGQL